MEEEDRRSTTSASGAISPRDNCCQMTIARFLDGMCLALRASGLWLRYASLQNLIPFLSLDCARVEGKEDIKFCHLATLLGTR